MEDINKTTVGDVNYSLKKAILGSIPLLGGTASELFSLVVTPPLEKRRAEWMDEVSEKLKALEAGLQINLETLSQNEQFIDTIFQATTFALKTSEKEKIEALKNAVVNTALGECPNKTKSQIFLNLVDSFTIWHIKILHFFDNPRKWFKEAGRTAPESFTGSLSGVLIHAYPELKRENDLIDLIWKDLHDAGFHRSSSLSTMMTGSGTLEERTTEMGEEFLEFISTHE